MGHKYALPMPLPVGGMIILAGSTGAHAYRRIVARYHSLGILLSPATWRCPWCPYYACDNDAFSGKFDESKWFKMLDKITRFHSPIFVLLPDVVGDWPQTIDRAYKYRDAVKERGLVHALALQDGCEKDGYEAARKFDASVLFVGGSKEWKWRHSLQIREQFWDEWLHIGRVNGERLTRAAKRIGADSIDGTGINKFTDVMQLGIEASMRPIPPSPQMELRL